MREERLRDLGGLALEMYKRDRFNAGLVVERCAELVAIEARVQEIDALLDGTRAHSPRRRRRALHLRRADPPRRAVLRELWPARSGLRRAAGRPDRTRLDDACPRCREPLAAGQEYCLECGARVYERARIRPSLTARAARFAPWPPRRGARRGGGCDRRDGWRRRRSTIETAIGGFATAPQTSNGESPAGPSGVAEWPTGEDGWTIALASLPQTGGRPAALARARAARAKGLTAVGLLDSSRYASLHPGYWIVFSGIYASEAEATSALEDARRFAAHGDRQARRPVTSRCLVGRLDDPDFVTRPKRRYTGLAALGVSHFFAQY